MPADGFRADRSARIRLAISVAAATWGVAYKPSAAAHTSRKKSRIPLRMKLVAAVKGAVEEGPRKTLRMPFRMKLVAAVKGAVEEGPRKKLRTPLRMELVAAGKGAVEEEPKSGDPSVAMLLLI
jgi:hypothetical protein